MAGNVIDLSVLALRNLPELEVLGEVHRFVDFYFFHFDFPFESLKV
jgi:hypothetical protein